MTVRDQDVRADAPLDATSFRLWEMAEARWRGDVSPRFEGALRGLESAIGQVAGGEPDWPIPWPPRPLAEAVAPRLPAPALAPGGEPTDAGVATLALAIADGTVSSAAVVEALL